MNFNGELGWPLILLSLWCLIAFSISWYGLSLLTNKCTENIVFKCLQIMAVSSITGFVIFIGSLLCHINCNTPDYRPSNSLLFVLFALILIISTCSGMVYTKIDKCVEDSDKAKTYQSALLFGVLIPTLPVFGYWFYVIYSKSQESAKEREQRLKASKIKEAERKAEQNKKEAKKLKEETARIKLERQTTAQQEKAAKELEATKKELEKEKAEHEKEQREKKGQIKNEEKGQEEKEQKEKEEQSQLKQEKKDGLEYKPDSNTEAKVKEDIDKKYQELRQLKGIEDQQDINIQQDMLRRLAHYYGNVSSIDNTEYQKELIDIDSFIAKYDKGDSPPRLQSQESSERGIDWSALL